MASRERRRFAILPRLGIRPANHELVNRALKTAIDEASPTAGPDGLAVLDAGCGRISALKPFRPQIGRFVGADIHAPAPGALPYLDEFAAVDLCADRNAFARESFDVILSSFTVEHFADPESAFRNLHAWLRPGGRLVITTVNRRHPFVRAYLAMPVAATWPPATPCQSHRRRCTSARWRLQLAG